MALEILDQLLADKPCRTCQTTIKSHQKHCLPCGLRARVQTFAQFGHVGQNPATELDVIRYRRELENLHRITL